MGLVAFWEYILLCRSFKHHHGIVVHIKIPSGSVLVTFGVGFLAM